MVENTTQYTLGRWNLTGLKTRPQAIAWADDYQLTDNEYFIPKGQEWKDWIILSDHNRGELDISCQRIENKQRMIDGTMRSYHIADKNNFSFSWEMIPSRAFSDEPQFNGDGILTNNVVMNTVDGGAGGVEMKSWYENHTGSFWMLLAYDRYDIFPSGSMQYQHLGQYNTIHKVYFSSFETSVRKRTGIRTNGPGGSYINGFDFWNVSISLEEA
jgi:hypothetical protein